MAKSRKTQKKPLEKQKFRWEDPKNLNFDVENPRLALEEVTDNEFDLIKTLWENMAVDEIAMSIATNGFFQHEPLFVTKDKKGKQIVIEGNRRLAAVKLILNPQLRKELDIRDFPRVPEKIRKTLYELPVIDCTREGVWHEIAFKHINGAQPWTSFSKAKYVDQVHTKFKVSIEQIARQIGDRHHTVMRFYQAWQVLKQAKKRGIYDYENRSKKHFAFSYLMTGLGYTGIRKFIGLPDSRVPKENPVPKTKFKELELLLTWLYGTSQDRPLVQKHNPHLGQLDRVLHSKNGVAALKSGDSLEAALSVSLGDIHLFRESLGKAKSSLEKAKSKVVNGFEGEPDLLETAYAVHKLAKHLLDEMEELSETNRKLQRRR